MGERRIGGNHIFKTAIGWIGVAWIGERVSHVQLPERDRAATLKRLLARGASKACAGPPAAIGRVVASIELYARGERIEFWDVELAAPERDRFQAAILARTRLLRHGETTTYGQLAADAGYPGMAREAGQALGANPVPLVVPCHRVVAAGGKLGGFSAAGGIATKRLLLGLERARPLMVSDQSAFAF